MTRSGVGSSTIHRGSSKLDGQLVPCAGDGPNHALGPRQERDWMGAVHSPAAMFALFALWRPARGDSDVVCRRVGEGRERMAGGVQDAREQRGRLRGWVT